MPFGRTRDGAPNISLKDDVKSRLRLLWDVYMFSSAPV